MNRKHGIVAGAFAVAFALVSYLGWALLIKPVKHSIQLKLAEKDEVSKSLNDAKTKAAQYDKFRAQAENIRRDLNLISVRLDSDFSVREMNRTLARIYSISTLRMATVAAEKRDKSKAAGLSGLDEVPFTIAFSGGYHGLGNFLNGLVSGQRIFVPMTLDLKGNDTDSLDNMPVSGSIKVSLFMDPAGAAK